MKHFFYILLVSISVVSKICAQSALDFTLSENQIVIKNDISTVENIFVFKGEIAKDKLASSSPILGKTIRLEKEIQFIPLVQFGWNQKYTVVYNDTIRYFSLPIPKNYEFLTVSEIYPSASALPSNLLKWYIKFSKPINTVQAYNHIKLVSANGDTLSRAILPLENVLISEDGTLLTVWMEPGRQKRGLIPNEQLGVIFSEQESYHLIISKEIKDDNGVSMNEEYTHPFMITTADRVKPNIHDWKLNIPKGNSVSNLLIQCAEPLDYGSCIDNITVLDSNQIEVKGNWKLIDKETVLSFTPFKPWKNDNYQILFKPSIEDLAGNNLNRLFDSEINDNSNKMTTLESYKLKFVIK
ncbi:Ig-like domain-containing protein [Aquimarina rubra]|uniref:Ig-like domain-containing protein n=1 Tax=Aquimarina rubra TaxID=1920033 RepID=A0ABW5LE01_9FLAO